MPLSSTVSSFVSQRPAHQPVIGQHDPSPSVMVSHTASVMVNQVDIRSVNTLQALTVHICSNNVAHVAGRTTQLSVLFLLCRHCLAIACLIRTDAPQILKVM